MKRLVIALFIGLSIYNAAGAQELPKAVITLDRETKKVKIYSLVAPNEQFANATHIIELPHQLILVDGQFFAAYGRQLKAFTDSLKKPVTRFYISHDHPDHFLGFGDAFINTDVYALAETKAGIDQNGQTILTQRQKQYGDAIAKNLIKPNHIQNEGKEVIDGVTFIFEKSSNNESPVSLIIKLPEAKAYIAQDIVYNKTHLFIEGKTDGWKTALRKVQAEKDYTLILPGHGKATDKKVIAENLAYLDFADKTFAEAQTKKEYKSRLIAKFPDYAAPFFIDIYLNYYLKKDWKA